MITPQLKKARDYELAQGDEYPNGRTTMCFVGDYDESTDVFREKNNQIVDSGIDFYAPQMVKSPDGRTIMIGWMANLDVIEHRQPIEKWYGMMTLPRQLSVRDGVLYQQPIQELEQLRRNPARAPFTSASAASASGKR